MSIFRCGIPFGGQTSDAARIVKYAPKNAAKNIASEATNSTIPRTGPLISRRRAAARRDGRRAHVVPSLAGPCGGRTPAGPIGSGAARRSCAAGGGEVVAHSSVFAPHGSSGAVRGLRSVRKTFDEEDDHGGGDHERADRRDAGSGSSIPRSGA